MQVAGEQEVTFAHARSSFEAGIEQEEAVGVLLLGGGGRFDGAV